jgi:diacylglycerol kinase family enzyme
MTCDMRLMLMANPASGGGTDPDRLRALLERHGAQVVDHDPERIVVAGGDGTVALGAGRAAELGVPLAVIPAGTANDFARTTGIPLDEEEAARLAATGTRLEAMELGRMDDRPFVNVASTGLAPAAARRAAPLKRLLGPLAYSAGALAAGALERPVEARVVADGEELFHGRAWQVTVACTGAFGGGSEIAEADPHDGWLDLVIVPDGPRAGLARRAIGMRRGTLTQQPGVVHRRAGGLLTISATAPFNVDGEIVPANGPARFTARRNAFELVVSGDGRSPAPRRRGRGA